MTEEQLQQALKEIRDKLADVDPDDFEDGNRKIAASLKIIDKAIGPEPEVIITGKAIHVAFISHNREAQAWELLSPKSQAAYNMIADKLNKQFLTPLRGLIRDFADLIDGDCLELEYIGNKRDALLERTRILCGKE